MQQTRIEQGAPYYLKFVGRFPDVITLANAPEDEVLKYWQGLGYYSRARNLHKAARRIVDVYGGVFPSSFDELLGLPGIGPYSAAAIASFAYELPYPVVDGNVKRVVARYAGITDSIDDPATHDAIREFASKQMKGASPGAFNQAIMNFGALVCKPKNPLCQSCGLSKRCIAFNQQLTSTIPVRSKTKTNKLRHFHFFILQWRGKIALLRREEKDIWQGLYTPPVIERQSSNKPSSKDADALIDNLVGHHHYEIISSTKPEQQLLSHQTIIGRFYVLKLLSAPKKMQRTLNWLRPTEIQDYGKPKMVNEALKQLI